MARDFKDLVITDLADQLARTEALLVAYRLTAVMAIDQAAELTQQNKQLQCCLRNDLAKRFDVDLESETA
jgi:hypothetical protein